MCDLVFRDVKLLYYTFKCINLFLCTEYSVLFLLHEKLNRTHMNRTLITPLMHLQCGCSHRQFLDRKQLKDLLQQWADPHFVKTKKMKFKVKVMERIYLFVHCYKNSHILAYVQKVDYMLITDYRQML